MIELFPLLFATFAAPPVSSSAPFLAAPAAALQGEAETQDPPEIVDERPEIGALLERLAQHVKMKGKEDPQAISTIDTLYGEFAKSGPKDRASIVRELDKCFKVRRQELEEDVRDNRLHIAAAVALGGMAPESVKVLIALVGQKNLRDDLTLQEKIVLSLGKTKDPAAVPTLLELLKHHEPRMVAAGAEALGQFGHLEQKERKGVFEDLLKTMMQAKGKVDADPLDTISAERYNTIVGPIVTTLKLLTGQEIRDPQEWQHWWNKNKKEDWDAGREASGGGAGG
ncbi:MAG: HEAT repeat domain-containing protein [Planctomycetota bacterium]